MLHCSWDMVRDGCNYFSFLAIVCPFIPPQQPKIQNFEKMKKTLGDIIFLHNPIENYDQMMCGSWDMVCNKYNCYFSFWTIFYPFNPVTTKKNQNFDKIKKKHEHIIILHKCTKNYDQMMYGSWDMLPNRRTDGQTEGKSDI